MGATLCCQLQQTQNKFRGDIYKLEAFQLTQMLHDDPIIQEWLQQNKNSQTTDQSEEHNQQRQFLKLNQSDTYYYCNWKNSLAQGKGFAYKPNVLFFSGNFQKGVPEGKANVKLINQQCQYQGDVKGWRAHGVGTFYNSKNNYKILGEWENSKIKTGTINFYSDSNILNIHILNMSQRIASINYKDGRKYQGEISIKSLIPHGTGNLQYNKQTNKKSYSGQWYLGQFNGKGKLEYCNGTQYEGQFLQGQKQGFGRYTYSNGNYFEGYWHNGKQFGVGACFSIIGDTLKYGLWQDGKFKNPITKQKWKELSQIQKSKHPLTLQQNQQSYQHEMQNIKRVESEIQMQKKK